MLLLGIVCAGFALILGLTRGRRGLRVLGVVLLLAIVWPLARVPLQQAPWGAWCVLVIWISLMTVRWLAVHRNPGGGYDGWNVGC